MRVTAIQVKLNETGRTGLSAALKNAAAGQRRSGYAAQSANFQPVAPFWAEKFLLSRQAQAIFTSNGGPLGECRLSPAMKSSLNARRNPAGISIDGLDFT